MSTAVEKSQHLRPGELAYITLPILHPGKSSAAVICPLAFTYRAPCNLCVFAICAQLQRETRDAPSISTSRPDRSFLPLPLTLRSSPLSCCSPPGGLRRRTSARIEALEGCAHALCLPYCRRCRLPTPPLVLQAFRLSLLNCKHS